jgi:uncharacterized membrane protein YkoI
LQVHVLWAIMQRMKCARIKLGSIAIVPALLAILAAPAQAERVQDQWRVPQGHAEDARSLAPPSSITRASRVSMEEAIDTVQRKTGGKVLDARRRDDAYRIKILTRRGEVRVLYVDARTGELR